MLETDLLPNATHQETRVFYLKILGCSQAEAQLSCLVGIETQALFVRGSLRSLFPSLSLSLTLSLSLSPSLTLSLSLCVFLFLLFLDM